MLVDHRRSCPWSPPALVTSTPVITCESVSVASCTLSPGRKPPSPIFITRASASVVEARTLSRSLAFFPSAICGNCSNAAQIRLACSSAARCRAACRGSWLAAGSASNSKRFSCRNFALPPRPTPPPVGVGDGTKRRRGARTFIPSCATRSSVTSSSAIKVAGLSSTGGRAVRRAACESRRGCGNSSTHRRKSNDKPCAADTTGSFPRTAHSAEGGVQPQGQESARLRRGLPRTTLDRLNPLVQLRQVEAADVGPNGPCFVLVGKEFVQRAFLNST